jgi:hypothetical protein
VVGGGQHFGARDFVLSALRRGGPARARRRLRRGTLLIPFLEADLDVDGCVLDLDPLAQRVTLAMNARLLRDGEVVATKSKALAMTLYFKDEIVLMLERAGFCDVEVRAAYADAEPTGEDDFLVFSAR